MLQKASGLSVCTRAFVQHHDYFLFPIAKCQADTGLLHSCFLISFSTHCWNARSSPKVEPCNGCVIRKDPAQAKKEADEKAKKEAAAAQAKNEAEEIAKNAAAAAAQAKEAEDQAKVCLVFPRFVFGQNLVLAGNSGHLIWQFWECRLGLCS